MRHNALVESLNEKSRLMRLAPQDGNFCLSEMAFFDGDALAWVMGRAALVFKVT